MCFGSLRADSGEGNGFLSTSIRAEKGSIILRFMNSWEMRTGGGHVTCGSCGRPLPATENEPWEGRQPCPDCGSSVRAIAVGAADSLTLQSSLGLKLRRADSPRVVQEQSVGAALSADGSWVEKSTLHDREADRYLEHVVGPDGTVIHHEEGRLSQHRDHGSDKPELRPARDAARRTRIAERAARKARRDDDWRTTNGG